MAYADVEALLCTWITDTLGLPAVTQVPATLTTAMPLAVVQRFGGADDVLTIDSANVDIDVFAATAAASRDWAEQIRASLRLAIGGHTANDLTVARVRTITAPARRDWQATGVYLTAASYQIVVHARRIAA